MFNLLAACFNQDRDFDYGAASAVYPDVFDGLPRETRCEYLGEAPVLQMELDDDDAVKAHLRYVGAGLSPEYDLGLTPRGWLDALAARLEHPTG